MTRSDRAGLLVWPLLALAIGSAVAAVLALGAGLAAAWVLWRRARGAESRPLYPGPGCRRLGRSLVLAGVDARGRPAHRWLWPGDLPAERLRGLRVALECANRPAVRT